MKIQSSNVTMTSSHHELSLAYKESATMEVAKSKDAVGAILTLSQEGSSKNVKEAMLDYQKQEKEAAKKKQKENEARSLKNMAELMRTQRTDNSYELPEEEDLQIKLLKQILAMLRGEKIPEESKIKPDYKGNVTDLRSALYKKTGVIDFSIAKNNAISLGTLSNSTKAANIAKATNSGIAANSNMAANSEKASSLGIAINSSSSSLIGTNANGTTWQRITATSGFISESENTTFATKGIVQTADGRDIDFNLEVNMSRSFMQETNLIDVKEYIKTDPLMINLDTNIGTVSDQKFFFDLDSDGKEEEISFAGQGSGFLALDKNGDGKINDGSELFGTASGDGFKDLASFDEDGNGWIDENDSIFDRLRVWTKDEKGNDHLIDLKKADVGAIYLGNANTQFSLKDDKNNLNAEIKKTGIYLRESSGAAGTLNHVDLVV